MATPAPPLTETPALPNTLAKVAPAEPLPAEPTKRLSKKEQERTWREKVIGENEISLKVIFANHDGVHSIIDISLDSTCGDLKKALLLEWPDVATLQPPPAEERIRLICMGRGMLQPPPSLLSTFGIAKFSTHPTPINCSIRPADVPIKPPPPAKALANALTNMVRSPPSNPLAPQAAAAPPAGEAGTVPYPNNNEQPAIVAVNGCSCLIM